MKSFYKFYRLHICNEEKILFIVSNLLEKFFDNFQQKINFSKIKTIKISDYTQTIIISKKTLSLANDFISILANKLKISIPLDNWICKNQKSIEQWEHPLTNITIFNIEELFDNSIEILRMQTILMNIFINNFHKNIFVIHAASIRYKDKAYLLAGPSGVGKSTACEKIKTPWKIISDDQSIIIENNKGYQIHPFPTWSNYYENNCNIKYNLNNSSQLAGIFFIKQEQQCKIGDIEQAKASILLNQSLIVSYYAFVKTFDKSFLKNLHCKIFDFACDLAQSVPVNRLDISLNGEYWKLIEKT